MYQYIFKNKKNKKNKNNHYNLIQKLLKKDLSKLYEIDKNWQCPICTNQIHNNISIGSPYNCRHSYCYDCLRKIHNKIKCPICTLALQNIWKNEKIPTYNLVVQKYKIYFAP